MQKLNLCTRLLAVCVCVSKLQSKQVTCKLLIQRENGSNWAVVSWPDPGNHFKLCVREQEQKVGLHSLGYSLLNWPLFLQKQINLVFTAITITSNFILAWQTPVLWFENWSRENHSSSCRQSQNSLTVGALTPAPSHGPIMWLMTYDCKAD